MLQVLVPSISAGPKPKWNTWLAVSLAMLGLFIISESQSAADKSEMDVGVGRWVIGQSNPLILVSTYICVPGPGLLFTLLTLSCVSI